MTLAEILEQAKQLSADERQELAQRLLDTLDVPSSDPAGRTEQWGHSLNQLLDELDPIELHYPDIDDPVAWVARLRAERRQQRFDDAGIDE